MDRENDSGPKSVESSGEKIELEDKEVGVGDESEDKEQQQQEEEQEDEKRHLKAASSPSKDDLKMALSVDPTKVKFTNSEGAGGNQNGEAKVDIENVQVAFAGMGKEELMNYADDPFWVKLRWSLFALFWLLWAAMLVGAIIIVVTTPGCAPLPARDWWQKGAVYQVYPKSFKDSDGDGIGDIKGIESELSYFKDLGVNTLWINPVYKSPMEDGGFDISDFRSIDPIFGTMEDFKSLLKSAHENDLQIVMEYVPNHSSRDHEWFQMSQNRNGNYTNYYIWADGKDGGPPNNWKSVFGGSAWTYDDVRRQYYYHQFLSSQPDLNLRDGNVRKELEDILVFWLDIGVDGFRVDAVIHLYEDEALLDEPVSTLATPDSTLGTVASDYESLNHTYTRGLPENMDALRDWRKVLNSYEEKDAKHRLMVVEAYEDVQKVKTYYGTANDPLADFPFNFLLLDLSENSSAKDVSAVVSSWFKDLDSGNWSNWVLGNHDVSRVATRTSPSLVDAYNMMTMLLGGTPVTYYGEEIGMVDVAIPLSQTVDKKVLNAGEAKFAGFSRDFARTPMQWNGNPGAGFTNSTSSWLPIGPSYNSVNVEAQKADPESHLEIYKKLVKLRKEPAFLYGGIQFLNVTAEDVFSFVRVKKGSPGYAVFINFGKNATDVAVTESECCEMFKLPDNGLVELRSGPNIAVPPIKAKIYFNGFSLGPSEAVVINFVPKYE